MRLLFSSPPSTGHVLPLLPVATAARRAGHATALLSDAGVAPLVRPLHVLPVGSTMPAMLAEHTRRTGAHQARPEQGDLSDAARFFSETRVDLTLEGALQAARDYSPDLIVAGTLDGVGPLIAAALKVPWATHTIGMALPDAMVETMARALADRAAAEGWTLTPRLACLDLWPERLQPGGWHAPPDRITVRPQPHDQDGAAWPRPSFPGRENRPLVLVTLGTVVRDPALLSAVLAAVTATDVNVIVTLGSDQHAAETELDRTQIHPAGFVPLAQLLPHVEAVVTAGGAGTLLGSLSAGRPLVVLPVLADQPLNAERAARLGVALAVQRPDEVGPALQRVLADPSYRAAAASLAHDLTLMHSPEEALRLLLARAQPL